MSERPQPSPEGNGMTTDLTFDAGLLARGWLAASLAATANEDLPILDGTLLIESYDDGVRLTSTDRYMLLTTWVAAEGSDPEVERSFEEAPNASTVVRDPDSRGRALLSYLRKLSAKAAKDSLPPPMANLRVGVLADEGPEAGFPGMELQQVVIDFPEHEKLALPVVHGDFPAYRSILLGHQPARVSNLLLNPELFSRLGQVGKITGGFAQCTFAGVGGAVAVEITGAALPPVVRGVVMPMKPVEVEVAA